MFVLDRTCKEHCSLPIQKQGSLGEMKRGEKRWKMRGEAGLFFVIMVLKAWMVLGFIEPFM